MNRNILAFKILKWIPRILMLGIVGFSVYVYFNYGAEPPTTKPDGQQSQAEGPIHGKDRPVVGRVNNIEYSHFDKGRMVYHVNATKTVTLKSKMQQLENPEFIFYDENQKETLRVTGKHCNISRDFTTITVFDDTLVKSATGMKVSSHIIKYDGDAQEFSTTANANFDWNTLKGRSKGFVFKSQTEILTLPDSPEITYVNRASDNRSPILMKGDRGMIDHLTGFAYFEGNVVITQRKDKITAQRIEAYFEPGGHNLEKITAIKDVSIKFARPDKGGPDKPPAATAATMPAGTESQEAPSLGNVFTTDSASGKDLDAELAELYFAEDGTTIKSFRSEGDCTFVLHTYGADDKPKENRIIKGDAFGAEFNAKGDMEKFNATDNVSVKLQPLGNSKKDQDASKQTIYCKNLIADFIPDTGDVKQIQFNEGFKHVQGSRTVSSDSALYSGDQKKTDLIGNPQIEDATLNITSTAMQLYEATNGINAQGNVKSAFVRGEGKNPSTFPFSSPSNDPVYISAETMDWDAQKAEATYKTKAKLWQDKNVITADRIIINDKENTLSAYDKVHTIFYNRKDPGADQSQTKPSGKDSKTAAQTQTQPQTQTQHSALTQKQSQSQSAQTQKIFADTSSMQDGPISVDAGIMNYVEKDRIVHFEKDVKIVTQTTKINGERADFFLKDKASDFDRLVADGRVEIHHEQKTGTSSQATFFADEKKLVLEGQPKLTEPGNADILGRVLTLFLADDRILIDGEEDGRAATTLQMKPEAITSPTTTKKKDKSKENNPPDADLKD